MMFLFKKVFFHSDRRPRKWVKFLVFGRDFKPRFLMKNFVYDRQGNIRVAFNPWMQHVIDNPPISVANNWQDLRSNFIKNRGGCIESLLIISNRQTVFVANYLKKSIENLGFNAEVAIDMPQEFCKDLYIVICPQTFERLPPKEKRIVFQMEQSINKRWFKDEYLNILYNSLAIFDYSLNNVDFLRKKGIPRDAVFHIPLMPITAYCPDGIYNEALGLEKFDVFFYGDVGCKRRKLFLDALRVKFNVRVENNIYGQALWDALACAKVVVNIHYYENALLETTRICECLSLGVKVVSEEAVDQEQYKVLESLVKFTPINDVDAMVAAVEEVLSQDEDSAVNILPYFDESKSTAIINKAFEELNISFKP